VQLVGGGFVVLGGFVVGGGVGVGGGGVGFGNKQGKGTFGTTKKG